MQLQGSTVNNEAEGQLFHPFLQGRMWLGTTTAWAHHSQVQRPIFVIKTSDVRISFWKRHPNRQKTKTSDIDSELVKLQ